MNIPDFAVTGLVLITIMSFAVLVGVLIVLKFNKDDSKEELPQTGTEPSEIS